jgi:DNA-binding CsgD family transcriptional regulator
MTPAAAAASTASAEFYGRLLSCTSYEQMGSNLLEPLGRHVDASSSVFLQFVDLPSEQNLVAHRAYIGSHPRSVDVYVEGVYNDDPILQPSLRWMRSGMDGQGAFVTLLSGIPGWRDNAYYQKFLKSFDIGHVLALAVRVRSVLGAETMCLGFHRACEAHAFSPGEVARLRELVPVVQAVLSNLAYREAVSLSGTLLDAVSDSGTGMGFVVLDEDLLVRHANRRGLEQLALYDCRMREAAQRSGIFGELRQRLLRQPANAGQCHRFTLGGTDLATGRARSLDVAVRGYRAVDGHMQYLLITSESGEQRALDAACARLELSERETEVARLICAGQSNAEIGRGLGIALRTVENHLRSVYAKVGVNSRTQLVSRLLGLN